MFTSYIVSSLEWIKNRPAYTLFLAQPSTDHTRRASFSKHKNTQQTSPLAFPYATGLPAIC